MKDEKITKAGVKSEPEYKYTDRDKSINWDASETELRAEPVPAPDRLLSDEEINEVINKVLYPFSLGQAYRNLATAQDAKTSALVRAECQEEIKELKDTIRKQEDRFWAQVEDDTKHTAKLQATHKAELERVFQVYDDYIELLVDELNSMGGVAYVHGWRSTRVEAGEKARANIKALKKSSLEGK